jgi:hypothetical protein
MIKMVLHFGKPRRELACITSWPIIGFVVKIHLQPHGFINQFDLFVTLGALAVECLDGISMYISIAVFVDQLQIHYIYVYIYEQP